MKATRTTPRRGCGTTASSTRRRRAWCWASRSPRRSMRPWRRRASACSGCDVMTGFISATDTRGVATVTLDRPQVHNAFDDALIAALTVELKRLDGDAGVRVVVLAA